MGIVEKTTRLEWTVPDLAASYNAHADQLSDNDDAAAPDVGGELPGRGPAGPAVWHTRTHQRRAVTRPAVVFETVLTVVRQRAS